MKPDYERDDVRLYHARWEDVPWDALAAADAIVADSPWGMDANTDSSRFSGGNTSRGAGVAKPPVVDDDKPFDPSPWLDFPKVVLFGANHFAQRLPVGTTLVWIKRSDRAFGTFLSDAEIAWRKGGHGVYCFREPRPRPDDDSHPTEKPVALMRWVIQGLKLEPGSLIADPFMGSGSTGVAAVREGFRFVGVECVREHFDTAVRRIDAEIAQGRLFG